MSLLNLFVSAALSISPDELNAVQKASRIKTHKDSEQASEFRTEALAENVEGGKEGKETKTDVKTYRVEDAGKEADLPAYSPRDGEGGKVAAK